MYEQASQDKKSATAAAHSVMRSKGRAKGDHRDPVQVNHVPAGIQKKLTVNHPGDAYEQQADRVADQVMRMSDAQIQRKCADCEEEGSAEGSGHLMRQEAAMEEEEPGVMRKESAMEEEEPGLMRQELEEEEPGVMRKESAMEEEEPGLMRQELEEEEPGVMRKESAMEEEEPGLMRQELEEEEPGVMRKESDSGTASTEAPDIVHDVINGGGNRLDRDTRSFMEPRFGQNFSNVRVHTDSKAAESAQAVNARAYTVGNNVVFNKGEYSPGTSSGRQLLAHELTHVVQQGGGSSGVQRMNNILQRSVKFKQCGGVEQNSIQDAHVRAMEMLNIVIPKLESYDGTNPAEVKTALDTHLHDSSTRKAKRVAHGLKRLRKSADSPKYACKKKSKGSTLAMTIWCIPWTNIQVFPLFHADSLDVRAATLIHEWAHRYSCKLDLGYNWDGTGEKYKKSGPGRAFLNADAWSEFVRTAV